MRRYLTVMGLLALGALAVGVPAAAQARVVVGVGIGVPVYRPYYPYPYYAPVYYPPPAVVYAPPPVVVAPPQVAVPAVSAPAPTGYCRQYRGDATVDGAGHPFYGTACLQPDGRWHIVN